MIIQDGTLVKIISLKGEFVVSDMKLFLNKYAHIIMSDNYGELKVYELKMINPAMQQLNIKTAGNGTQGFLWEAVDLEIIGDGGEQ